MKLTPNFYRDCSNDRLLVNVNFEFDESYDLFEFVKALSILCNFTNIHIADFIEFIKDKSKA